MSRVMAYCATLGFGPAKTAIAERTPVGRIAEHDLGTSCALLDSPLTTGETTAVDGTAGL
jgi:hypothetical protein